MRRWVFQAGWPGFGAPGGVVMVRADVKASTDSVEDSRSWSRWLLRES